MAIQIEIVPCLSDNYAYLVKSDGACAVVDPSEAGPVRAALAKALSIFSRSRAQLARA